MRIAAPTLMYILPLGSISGLIPMVGIDKHLLSRGVPLGWSVSPIWRSS